MLIFEKSRSGRGMHMLPECDVPAVMPEAKDMRESALHLPEMSENDLSSLMI